MSKSGRFHSNCLHIGVLCSLVLFVACANVTLPQEQAALPPPPQYPPTTAAKATATASPAAQLIARAGAVNLAPTITPRPRPTLSPIAKQKPVHDLSALEEYHRGIAYVAVRRDEYRSPASQRALDELFATGANYISLLVTWYQTDVSAKEIRPTAETPSDQDLAFVVDYAHAHAVRVLLKPQVNFSYDEEHWRGQIQFDNEKDWQEWFDSYRQFILYYAQFAQRNGVEEFAVGTELFAATTRTADWRAIIRAVRKEYTGLLTYSANHSGEEVQIRFWNDLDYIGVNVFYHLTNYRTPTIEEIAEGWKLPVRQITNLHNAFPEKPIIFTEVGYPSMDLASVWPWNWQRAGAVDLEEQALLYEGLFQTWWHHPDRPWFRGMFIWNWLPNPDQGGPADSDFTPHNKPAEQILKLYYSLPASPAHSPRGSR